VANRRVSIKDVAREAGVSVTTVSHALNDKGRLNDQTRHHVREVASRLGYRPNPAARSLVSGHTGIVAAMASLPAEVAFTDLGYYTDLIGAATQVAISRDHALVVAPPSGGSFVWDRLPLDGVIVIDPLVDEPALPMLRQRGIPFVTIGRDPNGHERDAIVANDDVASARMVFDHFVERGAQRVGLLAIPPLLSFARDTTDAYLAWCRDRGQRPAMDSPSYHDLVGDTNAAVTGALSRLLDRPDPIDALYAPIEQLGVAAGNAASGSGVRIPQDLMLATTNDAGRAAAAEPSITTMESDYGEMGRRAGSMLLDMVEGSRSAPCVEITPTKIVARASTGG
jgi:DNA-binding LacI/PurR family transcriptional regulator